jgi:hypothetical protein
VAIASLLAGPALIGGKTNASGMAARHGLAPISKSMNGDTALNIIREQDRPRLHPARSMARRFSAWARRSYRWEPGLTMRWFMLFRILIMTTNQPH